jgi:hypothetical protein
MEKQCKSFDWFLTNVYPQKFILDSPVHVFAYGRVKNLQSGMCIDTMQNDDKVVQLFPLDLLYYNTNTVLKGA